MIGFAKKFGDKLRSFGISEKGVASVEFVVVFPFFMGVFLSSYEVAIMNIRAVMMERAVDLAVREIRLAGGAQIEHDDVRAQICRDAILIPECLDVTKIELTRVDRDTWTVNLEDEADCQDRLDEIKPPKNFQNGAQNDFMLIRVCATVDAVFPNFGVGRSIPKDENGGYIIMSSSAFVNEPN
ncbi:MAG: pilus assembly protein [Pseudomonadota bacterium]